MAIDTSGEAIKASAVFASNDWRVVGSAQNVSGVGGPVTLGLTGQTAPVLFASAPPASANGELVFLSAVAGEGSLTPPMTSGHVVMVVGVLQGADGVTTTPDVVIQPQFISRRP